MLLETLNKMLHVYSNNNKIKAIQEYAHLFGSFYPSLNCDKEVVMYSVSKVLVTVSLLWSVFSSDINANIKSNIHTCTSLAHTCTLTHTFCH